MVTDAFEQGRLAFRHNHPMSACRYPVGSDLRAQWMAGWNTARNAAPGGDGSAHPGMMSDARRVGDLGRPAAHES
ncbi:hypothetical protein E3C22_15185 [Jiella endophytica]|uniref:Ribosome modulation factor n=1 Tax=Jiella endophytica TaxID=2558362 RepID=A0A4Y8RGW8_9HYPH|nr:Rmf/CrpP family protein [Jiella endophytica]TFF21992.1 hypothetical protein E3C22_15185 [Jiella endophytica]